MLLESRLTDGPVDCVQPVDLSHPLNRDRALWLYAPAGWSGGSTWTDLCQRRRGVLAGGSAWALTPYGAGVDFTGGTLSRQVQYAGGMPTGVADPWSIGFWHRTTANVSLSAYFGFGYRIPEDPDSVPGGLRYCLNFNGNYYWWGAAADWDTGVPFDADSQWHRVDFTHDGTSWRLYRDGVLAAGPQSRHASTNVAGNYATVGGGHSSAAASASATVADPTILSRCWSADEVRTNYTLSRRNYPEVLRRIHHWSFAADISVTEPTTDPVVIPVRTPSVNDPVDAADPVNRLHPLNRDRMVWLYTPAGYSGGYKWPDLCNLGDAAKHAPRMGFPPWTPTRYGTGLRFDGSTQYAILSLTLPAVFTLAAWLIPDGGVTNDCFAGGYDGTGWIWRQSVSAHTQIEFDSGSASYLGTVAALSPGVPIRVGVSRDAAGVYRMAENGRVVSTSAAGQAAPSQPAAVVHLGRLPDAGAYYWPGVMADFTALSRAWTDSDFALDYDLSQRGYPDALRRVSMGYTVVDIPSGGGVTGSVTVTLDALTVSGAATVQVAGSLSGTLAALTLSAAGVSVVAGTLDATLDPVTLSSAGGTGATGTLSVTLDPVTLSSAGTVLVAGALSVTLDPVTLSSTGVAGSVTTGTLSVTLDAATLSSAGTVLVAGTLSATLDPVTLVSAATLAVTGTASVTLASLTLSGAGAVAVTGALSVTLAAVTLVATDAAEQPETLYFDLTVCAELVFTTSVCTELEWTL